MNKHRGRTWRHFFPYLTCIGGGTATAGAINSALSLVITGAIMMGIAVSVAIGSHLADRRRNDTPTPKT